jgi:ABC-type sugar transport system ATPase subunit
MEDSLRMISSDTPILEIRGICKSYGPVKALENVSLSVRPGEALALVGDNGA